MVLLSGFSDFALHFSWFAATLGLCERKYNKVLGFK